MKFYYYLLFRIYMFYKDSPREKGDYILSTSITSAVFLYFNILTIVGFIFINYRFKIDLLSNKFFSTFLAVLLWSINHYCLVRNEDFLKKGFSKNNVGTIFVFVYIILTFGTFVLTALKVRDIIMVK